MNRIILFAIVATGFLCATADEAPILELKGYLDSDRIRAMLFNISTNQAVVLFDPVSRPTRYRIEYQDDEGNMCAFRGELSPEEFPNLVVLHSRGPRWHISTKFPHFCILPFDLPRPEDCKKLLSVSCSLHFVGTPESFGAPEPWPWNRTKYSELAGRRLPFLGNRFVCSGDGFLVFADCSRFRESVSVALWNETGSPRLLYGSRPGRIPETYLQGWATLPGWQEPGIDFSCFMPGCGRGIYRAFLSIPAGAEEENALVSESMLFEDAENWERIESVTIAVSSLAASFSFRPLDFLKPKDVSWRCPLLTGWRKMRCSEDCHMLPCALGGESELAVGDAADSSLSFSSTPDPLPVRGNRPRSRR